MSMHGGDHGKKAAGVEVTLHLRLPHFFCKLVELTRAQQGGEWLCKVKLTRVARVLADFLVESKLCTAGGD